jgi:hypothetical protein
MIARRRRLAAVAGWPLSLPLVRYEIEGFTSSSSVLI